jgi:hypothetical protein
MNFNLSPIVPVVSVADRVIRLKQGPGPKFQAHLSEAGAFLVRPFFSFAVFDAKGAQRSGFD